MRSLLTTQSQDSYREQIHKEMMTRLHWKHRYGNLYPHNQPSTSPGSGPGLHTDSSETEPRPGTRAVLPPITMATVRTRSDTSLSSVSLPVTSLPSPPDRVRPFTVPPAMRAASPQTRQSLYQDSSHQGRGRSLYLRRRGQMLPEQKFDFPLVSSWEYGWRLGDFTLDYKTPTQARSSVVKSTFYARNGVFNVSSPTDTLG